MKVQIVLIKYLSRILIHPFSQHLYMTSFTHLPTLRRNYRIDTIIAMLHFLKLDFYISGSINIYVNMYF